MPFLADRLARVKTIADEGDDSARHRAESGVSVGEPDFDTPPNIKEAAKAAINVGDTKYTVFDGRIELKRAVFGKFKRKNVSITTLRRSRSARPASSCCSMR
jgi:aspartate aminotransferase